MIQSIKSLWSDRRGNVLAITGAALPLLIGSVGLATDTVQWTLWKRQLQRAADSAAFAGVYARFQDGSSSIAVTRDLANNNHLWVPLLSSYPKVSEPADTPTYTKTVEVSLAVQQELSFSSIFMPEAPIISVTARAAAIDSGQFCVIATEKGNRPGIIIQGSSQVNLGCGMISNSRSPTNSVDVNGNGHKVTAEPVAGVGVVEDVNGVSKEQSHHLPQPDPYENKYSTDIPPGTPCGNMKSHEVSTADGVTTLSPGCYSGNNQFSFENGSYKLQPGVYYLDGADFKATGGTITGDGVTIILTGTTPGQVDWNGSATVQLSAPTSGPYERLLLIQSTNATDKNNSNTINGNSASLLDGTIYFPNQQITLGGGGESTTRCAMVVARRVEFSGNANVQNDRSGCKASSTEMGKVIRLIG